MGIGNIILLGLISFFTDISTEMVYPIIPLYLASTFGATPVLIGFIEGIAECLASLLKVFSGYISDRFKKKKRLTFMGYLAGFASKALLLAAGSWTGVLAARSVDRIGKGIRTAPRDLMISESSEPGKLGRSFGLHKALDMAGSAIGILIAFLILGASEGEGYYRKIILLSLIPASIGLLLFLPVREQRALGKRRTEPFWKNMAGVDLQLKAYLLVTFLFTLGNSSNAFLLLRAKNLGFSDTGVILLYFLYNITASILSLPFGRRSDRIGRKKLLVAGYLVFALVYGGFALGFSKPFIIVMFLLYGAYAAMIAGVERAFLSEVSPVELRGTMLGLHGTLSGVALFPASLLAGLLWTWWGPQAPFILGACLSLAAALILKFFLKGGNGNVMLKGDES